MPPFNQPSARRAARLIDTGLRSFAR